MAEQKGGTFNEIECAVEQMDAGSLQNHTGRERE
jgi:hypothetical protein